MSALFFLFLVFIAPIIFGQNTHSPVFPTQSRTYNVSEMTSVGDRVFTCVATDDDVTGPAATLSYSIIGGTGAGTFSVNNVTCDVILTGQLDFESVSGYDVVIQTTDLDPVTPRSATATFTIQVTDVNEHDPIFVKVPLLPVPVPENTPVGTVVLLCSVSDGDSPQAPSGRHHFFITGGNVNKFSLDNTTCNLTLADDLSFENVSRYDLTITATDLDPTHPRNSSMVFSIEVLDVNERPYFKNLPGGPVLVREDVSVGTVIFTCDARDPDGNSLPRAQLVCNITGGNEAGMFDLDPSTCKVNVSRPLDFETLREYRLTVQAEDQDPENSLSTASPLVISVLDVNEHAPVFVNLPASPTQLGEHSNIRTTVITCTANDLDSASQPSGQLRFQITEGNDDGRFTMQNESVCLVTIAQALDFETRNSYSLTVTVRDLDPTVTLSATHTFQIRVMDENDKPILQTVPETPTVVENSPAGTFVFDCSATDQDNATLLYGQLKYSITAGNVAEAFTLKQPCRIETSKPLDHETRVFYDLEIKVTDLDPVDPKTDTRVYRVKVTEVNDNTPYFLSTPQTLISLPEDTPVGVPFLNCSGDDDDTPLEPTGHVRYDIIAGNEEGFFTINSSACAISLQKPVDYENTTLTFNLTVRIYDLDPVAPRSAEQQFQICVTNVNEHKPRFVSQLPQLTRMMENNPLGAHLGRCSAEDGDSPSHPSGHLRYTIAGGNGLSLFYLDPYTCDLYMNGLLDFEQKRSHVLKVVATDLDPDNPLRSDVMKVRIRVLDDNDYGPTCESSLITMEMSEDTERKSVIMTVNCSDLDQGRSSSSLRFTARSVSQTLGVERMTGNVKLLRKLDWDDVKEPRQHDLRVEVRDNWVTPISSTITVRVLLTDADDIKPVFQQPDYVGNVSESLPRGATVLRLSATDADAPNTSASTVQYGINKVSSPDWFLVHPYTGEVIVKDVLDADSFTKSRFEVFAFSSDRSQERSVVTVTVHVDNVNDSGPEFSQKLYYASVQESSTTTAPLVRVQATDKDSDHGGQVRYSIEEGPLTIDEVTGEVRVKGQLDFETRYFYAVRVEARDLGTPSLTGTATILLTVTPINEFDPVWISDTNFVVSEDTVPGTVVFQLSTKDNDSSWDGKVYYRSSLTPDLPFAVDQSGRVLLAAPLDRETKDSYTFSVIAYDFAINPDDRRSVTATMQVTVSDVNDLAPKCRRMPVAVVVYPWVGFSIASMDCSVDEDTVNGPLGYRIVGGNVDGAFEINSTTGRLTARRRPTLDTYNLSVEVSDGGTPAMTSLADVVILAEPKLTLSSLPANVRVREDMVVGRRVHQVTACCSFTTLRFQLLSGNDGKHFHLHGGSGVITLVRHLDRELTSRHVLTVQVSDERGQTSRGTLTVDVEDVNDNAPVFKPAFSVVKLPRNAPPGQILGLWRATDADEGTNAEVSYSLVNSVDRWARFSVDNDTGTVKLQGQLNPRPAGDNASVVSLLVVAVDGGDVALSSTATVMVEILKEDPTPQLLNTSGTITVPEDFPLGVVLLELRAKDPHPSEGLNYTLSSQNTPFQVLPDSGRVILRSSLDRERVGEYSLLFLAQNVQGGSASVEVKVQVQDVDDNEPVFSKSVYEFHVPHDTGADVIVGHVTVTDDDVGENANFTISIVSGNGAGYFVLEGGGLKTTRPLRYDGVREFGLTLRAQKAGSLADYRYSEAAVKIDILPALSQPKFDANSITLRVEENVVINTIISDVNATTLGATEGHAGTLRYVIRSGNDKGLFHIKEHTGELQVVGGIDYEKVTEFVLTVEAQRKGDPGVKDSIAITIKVINVNDNSPQPSSALYRFSVEEGSSPGSSVGQVLFTDADADLFGVVNLTISGCSKLSIDSRTGNITVKEPLNYTDDVRHGCVVTAADGGDPPRTGMTSVVIDVRDVNDHSPRFEGAPYSLEVSEMTQPGSTLTTVIATDPDEGEKGKVTFSIVSGDPQGVFSLNASTGHLLLVSNLSASQTSEYVLQLQAKDGGSPPHTTLTTLTLKVIDVNDHAPQFAEASKSLELTVGRVVSPGTELSILNASDEDSGSNAWVSFAITAGNAEGLFFLHSDSGRLSTRAWLTAAPTLHTMTVTATDHGTPPLSTSTTLTVYLSPPSPPPQNITRPSVFFQNFAVSENVSVGFVVGVFDPYPLSRGSSYVITYGNHDDSFEVVVQGGRTAQLLVKERLDYEKYRVYFLWLNISDKDATIRKLVQVNVTDINDNAPQFADGPTLVVHVPEHSPVGHTVWSLSVRDADHPATNGPLQFRVDSVSVSNVLGVTESGQVQLLRSPDYDSFQQVKAVISVRDSTLPQVSSTISVTLNIIDVEERKLVTVTPAVTMYISTEVAHNTKAGQVVHQLTAADFNLTQFPSSFVSFVFLDTNGAFAIQAKTGEVSVSDPQRLANDSVYFQWVVCKITEVGKKMKSEIATLRIDTYDKYENVVAVQLDLGVADLAAQKSALLQKLQTFFSMTQRVGIYDVISYGASARRRLLATSSLALVYVVENVSSDDLNNIMGPKTFLSQKQILQVLQQSPDGTPVVGLTRAPLSVDLVMPYLTGNQGESTPFTDTPHFPIIVAVVCLIVIVIFIFIVGCCVYRAKRKRAWNTQSDKDFKTPAPAFYIRKDSLFPDDVSIASSTSLLDDDSGVGDSVGSRSLPRKSLTPSSSESGQSGDDEDEREEVTLNPKTLMGEQAVTSKSRSRKQSTNSVNGAETSRRPRRKKFLWKKSKSKTADNTFVYTNPRPPLSWLPPLPDDPRSNRRDSSLSWLQSPRFGRRASGFGLDPYTPSDPGSARRGSQNWGYMSAASSRTGSEDSPSSSRRSSLTKDWAVSPYAIPLSGRRASAANVTTPVFTTGIGAVGLGFDSGATSTYVPSVVAASGPNSSPMSSEARFKSSGSSSDGEGYAAKPTIPGHLVTWKPKRNPAVKIFHEKLNWKAVSTIPKPAPLPSKRSQPGGLKQKSDSGPQVSSRDVIAAQTSPPSEGS